MHVVRSTLLTLCAIIVFSSPAAARSARHHAGLSHHHYHHHHRHRIARPADWAAANVVAVAPDRHSIDGPPMVAFSRFGLSLNGGGPVAEPRRVTARHRHIKATAMNSFASIPSGRQAIGAPSTEGFSSGGGGSVVAEARRWIGGNPTGRSSLWCGNFMNFVLQRTGHQGSSSNAARSFASYGHRISGPQVGAIAVMSRGARGGHVGVVSGVDVDGNPIIISGNHGHRVAESTYARQRIYAYVMP
jgi:uncharacterized protein (TIGR02594 family)